MFEKVEITRAVPVPTPYVKKVPIIRKIPVPVPNKKSVPDTKMVNETNVKIVGYQKTKPKTDGDKDEDDLECNDEDMRILDLLPSINDLEKTNIINLLRENGLRPRDLYYDRGRNIGEFILAL